MAPLDCINSQRGNIIGKVSRNQYKNLSGIVCNVKQTNLQTPNHVQLYQEIPQASMDFILIDIIGPFETTTRGNEYALTII